MRVIADIYKSTAASYSRPFNADVCNAWRRSLQDFTVSEVESAVQQWQQNVTPDFDGRALGSKPPQPADVRAICQQHRQVETQLRSGEFVACGQHGCAEGWVRIFEGRTVKGNLIDPRTGAVVMCSCRQDYLCSFYGCSRAELPQVLQRNRQSRRKAKAHHA